MVEYWNGGRMEFDTEDAAERFHYSSIPPFQNNVIFMAVVGL